MRTRALAAVDGRAVVVHDADGDDANSLTREALLLTHLRGRGVPDVVRAMGGAGRMVITVAYHPAIARPTAVDVAAAATTLAAGHARGWTHGAFDATCLTVGSAGRVVVDGWTGHGDPADDVAAVGRVLLSIDPEDPALRAAAARAMADAPARLTMAALAEALSTLASPATTAPAPRSTKPRRPPRRRLARSTKPPPPPRRQSARSTKPPRPHRRPRWGQPLALGALLVAGIAGLSVLPAPRPSGVVTASAVPVVEGDGQRWRLGGPGDAAAMGDWDCDGLAEPALLRVGGDVWVWSDFGTDPVIRGRAVGATGLAAGPAGQSGTGCAALVATDATGQLVPITPAPAASPPRWRGGAPSR